MQVDMSQTDNNLTNICSVFVCSVQDHRWSSVRGSGSGVRRWRSTGSPRYSLRPSLKVRWFRLSSAPYFIFWFNQTVLPKSQIIALRVFVHLSPSPQMKKKWLFSDIASSFPGSAAFWWTSTLPFLRRSTPNSAHRDWPSGRGRSWPSAIWSSAATPPSTPKSWTVSWRTWQKQNRPSRTARLSSTPGVCDH